MSPLAHITFFERVRNIFISVYIVGHHIFGDKAIVKQFSDLLFIEVLANENEFDSFVSMRFFPIFFKECSKLFKLAFVVDPLFLWHFDVPRLSEVTSDSFSGFMQLELISWVIC